MAEGICPTHTRNQGTKGLYLAVIKEEEGERLKESDEQSQRTCNLPNFFLVYMKIFKVDALIDFLKISTLVYE